MFHFPVHMYVLTLFNFKFKMINLKLKRAKHAFKTGEKKKIPALKEGHIRFATGVSAVRAICPKGQSEVLKKFIDIDGKKKRKTSKKASV